MWLVKDGRKTHIHKLMETKEMAAIMNMHQIQHTNYSIRGTGAQNSG